MLKIKTTEFLKQCPPDVRMCLVASDALPAYFIFNEVETIEQKKEKEDELKEKYRAEWRALRDMQWKIFSLLAERGAQGASVGDVIRRLYPEGYQGRNMVENNVATHMRLLRLALEEKLAGKWVFECKRGYGRKSTYFVRAA